MHHLSAMNDEQLRDYCNTLKQNKAMARQQLRMQSGGGAGMSDEHFDAMIDNMSPEMLKMSLSFAKSNPSYVDNQLKKRADGNNNEDGANAATGGGLVIQGTAGAPVAGAAVAPPGGMPPGFGNMEEMMNNPMVKEMMNNPDMMKQAMDMMNGGQGAAGGQPPDMQNLMKNPSMSNLMSNPAMLSQAVGMLKSNPAMMEMMQKQMRYNFKCGREKIQ